MCSKKARRKKKRDPAGVFLYIGESTFRHLPWKKIAMFLRSYYKNLLLLHWDLRAIIAFQLGLTPNKAHLNCPESNQGLLFSEEFGNFSCVQFGTGYCSDALFRMGKKGGWLETEDTGQQQWVREGLKGSIPEHSACPTVNQHIKTKTGLVSFLSGDLMAGKSLLWKCP